MRYETLGVALLSLMCGCPAENSDTSNDIPPLADMIVDMTPADMGQDMPSPQDMVSEDASPEDMAPDLPEEMTPDVPPDMAPSPNREEAFRVTAVEENPRALWLPEQGSTTRFTNQETFAGQTLERTFYVHQADTLPPDAPVVLWLHGGNGSARNYFSAPVDELARGEEVAWRKNSDTCQVTLEGVSQTMAGQPCRPPEVTLRAKPFLMVIPEGVLDPGALRARHWEDGRVPSPGWEQTEASRDDVGFIAHVLATVLDRYQGQVDTSRVYLIGGSNGGMMTQRIVCHVGDPRYPSLQRLTAASAHISTLPAAVYDGTDGRDRCGDFANTPLPLALFLGNGIDTPDCETEYECATPRAVVPGDGRIPYGTSGGRHNVFSPDLGLVMNAPDTFDRWREIFARLGGGDATATSDSIGYFTTTTLYTYPQSALRLYIAETQGGHHDSGGTRRDFHYYARPYAWLGQFQRGPDGALSLDPQAAYVTGDY